MANEFSKLVNEKHGRKLVWHDEFEGNALDMDKWCFVRTMGAADRDYDNSDKHVRVEDGNLHLMVWPSDKEGINYSLPEGVTTKHTMNFKYGYLEMCARVPFRHGAWPSFWMQSCTPFQKADYMAETDIFEIFSNPQDVVANIHKWGQGKHVMVDGVEGSSIRYYRFEDHENLNNEFHTYGFEWDEHDMRFYVDDHLFCTLHVDERGEFGTNDLPGMDGFHDPAFVILNNEIFSPGSSWHVDDWILTDADPMPIDYYIASMRLYQKEGEEIYLKDEIAAEAAKKQA